MQARRATPAFPAPSPTGPISTTTPANPTAKPATLAQVIRSPGTNRCASGSTSSGTTAIEMPANPEVTCSWAQLRSAKGSAFEKSPMPMQCSQIRRPRGLWAGGNRAPVAKANHQEDHRGDADPASRDRQRPESPERQSHAEERAAPDQPEQHEKAARTAATGQGG